MRTSAPTAAILRRVPVVRTFVAAIHTTTHPNVVRRFLLLEEGDTCDELRRAESERILRAQKFIAQASVRVLPDSEGGVTLVVDATDEIALVANVATSPGNPPLRYLQLGDGNLSGEGIYLAADWRDGKPFRNGFGAHLIDYQLFGRPYTFDAQGHQNPLGADWQINALHPYFTDVQRIAWLAQSGATDGYVQFFNDINSSHALHVARNFFDVGGIIRVGPPGRLSLFGATISGDDERPNNEPVLVTTNGFASDSTGAVLRGRYRDHRMARVNALWGVRDIGFARVVGFDALTATQDLPIGFQLGTLLGRSLSVLGSRDDDIFMAADLYVGAVGRNNGLRFQLEAEGRRSNDDNEWDGVLMDSRAVEYLKFTPRHTLTMSLEYSGGWRGRTPFNLTLSDPIGGVRGFAASNIPGGQRLVARLENHVFLGRPFNLGDLGVGAFVDAGRLWAGDVPYGVDTPFRESVGVSLLATVPTASSRMWHLDLAIARNPDLTGHHVELRIGNTDKSTFFLQQPRDFEAAREPTVPSSVFRWPR